MLFYCGTESITRHITGHERHITLDPLPFNRLQEPAIADDGKIESSTAATAQKKRGI